MISIDITVQAGDWQDEGQTETIIKNASHATMVHLGFADCETELSVLLTDDAHMADINGQWRNKQQPTNVLSFPALALAPGDSPGPMLGDIVLAHETIDREAKSAAKSVKKHLFHLTVHGLLHLCGYDHEMDSDAEIMEDLEKAILDANGIADPYMMPEQ